MTTGLARGDDPLLEAELRSLDRRLRALPEASMRRQRLLERLEELTPDAAYALVAAVLRRPAAPAPHLLSLREILQELLREGGAGRSLDPGLCRELYLRAEAADDEFTMRLFGVTGSAAAMRDESSALPRDVAEISLGMRRALARGVDLGMLDRLLLDADPVVIEHLLANPRITEEHVVRIAARRPIPASTLDCIQRSRRFGHRVAVRTALARNPYCPAPLAIALLGALPLRAVHDMADDSTLHPETRRHAAAELARRQGSA